MNESNGWMIHSKHGKLFFCSKEIFSGIDDLIFLVGEKKDKMRSHSCEETRVLVAESDGQTNQHDPPLPGNRFLACCCVLRTRAQCAVTDFPLAE